MTTYAPESVVCGACGAIFTRNSLMSTNAFGSADLDTRPPQMQRSTMNCWITQCPTCHYSGHTPAEFHKHLAPVLESDTYRAQLADTRYPELATQFLCAALLCAAGTAEEQEYVPWGYLHAAWVLEDARKEALAQECRSKAANGLLSQPEDPDSQPGARKAIIVDCLRRSGRFDEAYSLAEQVLSQGCEEVIGKVLIFQKQLTQKRDTGCYQISDAL